MFSRLVLLAVLCTSYVVAESPAYIKHATHSKRTVGRRGIQLESYYPPKKYETGHHARALERRMESYFPPKTYEVRTSRPIAAHVFDGKQTGGSPGKEARDEPGPVGVSKRHCAEDFKKATMSFVESHMNLSASAFTWNAGYGIKDRQYGYARQQHDGIPFANAVVNVALKRGKMASFGSSFVDTSNIADSKPSYDLKKAIQNAEEMFSASHNAFEPTLEYLARPDGSVALTHVIQVRNDYDATWDEVFVDAHTGDVLAANTFIADATYRAIPIERPDLRAGYELIKDPQDLSASPLGWHNDGVENYTSTIGNNFIVVTNNTNTFTQTNQSSSGLIFDYTYDDTIAPNKGENVDASRTQAFYLGNKVHDLFYKYGFTEDAFNFQTENFGKGGVGGDPVIMIVHDESDINNAFFGTPPDGQSGLCSMHFFNETKGPLRDSVFDTAVPVHEFTHGLTNRLTGGGSGRCLQSLESSGLGEGWSDAVAEWTQQTSAEVKDFVVGAYVTGDSKGIRIHPYSTDPEVNPLRYSSLQELDAPHAIGTVWANILHNIYAALVEEHGWSSNAWTDPDSTEGNVVFLNLLIDALPLQPCNPTFLEARDAWIEADEDEYDGANKCLLWRVFASRGLGMKAKDYEDDETVPRECQSGY
ncbi:hypothetical protein VNI00_013314 [Paramarasmius palmivorus]|uniref:Extracellular metalloproteinase n=1 Tax=Paramarasmius palmivorus TaxID=297713 RepID=A0AAW0C134_9AGAR